MTNKVKLGEICEVFIDGDWIESKDQSANGFRLIQTGNIGNGIYLDKSDKAKYISEKTFFDLKCTEVQKNDILISRLPDPVGRACKLTDLSERAITAVDCTICRVDESVVLADYLVNFFQTSYYFGQINQNVTGTTRKRISRSNLAKIEVPLKPINVQRDICHKISILDSIIKARNEQLVEYEHLVKSRYSEEVVA